MVAGGKLGRRLRALGLASVVALTACAGGHSGLGSVTAEPVGPAGGTSTSGSDGTGRAIVLADSVAAARLAVERAGGTVDGELSALGGVVAVLGTDALAAVRRDPAVTAAEADRPMVSMSSGFTVTGSPGSAHNVTIATGAQLAWQTLGLGGRRATGQNVRVAVVDTAVARGFVGVHGGRSFTGGTPDEDRVGHGTAMASLTAGNQGGQPARANSPARFQGMAPEAQVVPVRVGAPDGSVSAAFVVAGIDWVIQNAVPNRIRVLNLSLGAAPVGNCRNDALALAVERAWKAGIVVVASAGNGGPGSGVASPACSPYAIAVGAHDHRGTLTTADDTVAEFSSGPTSPAVRRPDLVAPGVSLQSVRVAGSIVDQTAPATSKIGTSFVLGSGTSQAAAVVSGAAAALISQRPELHPEQVRALLLSTAKPLAGVAAELQGAGRLDLAAAAVAPTPAAPSPEVAEEVATGQYAGPLDANATRWREESWNSTRWRTDDWASTRWRADQWASFSWR